ncbi:MAG TPA: MFS transporter [Caulifigura sp.]|jgi:MFS family permease|nr:MFS transporter [Caulifigura sp.]
MSQPAQDLAAPAAPNAYRLLWAGFMAIFAAGIGFAIRGGILDNWAREYNLTATQVGEISGAGFTGFCFGIIIGGIIADRIGYGKLVIAAFAMHVASAVVTFTATPENAYNMLFLGAFIFAIANGTLEAVANPLVATLFPHNRTHYLNILHASWPAGMVIGGACGWVLDDRLQLPWKQQFAIFLVPTVIYGLMFLGQRMPKSEAAEKGLSLGDMLKDVGVLGGLVVCFLLSLFATSLLGKVPNLSPTMAANIGYAVGGVLLIGIAFITKFSFGSLLLFVLFVTHAMVGAVELGTDNWIQSITGNILSSSEGKILFVFTSSVMFALRFCAHFIEKKLGLSPVGILLVCAVLACIGLNLTSRVETFGAALLALTVYGIGKTFFWPTMLAVASDRFPRTGAIAISIMGGIGMMSAGLVGAPGLGFLKDKYSAEALNEKNPALFEANKAEKPSQFMQAFETTAISATSLGNVNKKLEDARKADPNNADPKAALSALSTDERAIFDAGIEGDRRTLVTDSLIPATMAAIYLLLMVYFKVIGGYRPLQLHETELGTAES